MGKSAVENMKGLWQAWVRVARRIGTFQARVLLTILYGIALLPFGVCVRLFGDTLRTKKRPTSWLDRPKQPADIKWAHKQ